MRLFKKKDVFYGLLEQQALAAREAARAFLALAQDFGALEEHARHIDQIESDADALTHQLANKLDSTFITPLDKEDLRALSGALDDITDLIEAAAARVALYRLPAARPDLEPLLVLLVEITDLVPAVVAGLRSHSARKLLHELLVKVHEAENRCDRAFRRALADLFEDANPDPLMIMKWKEVYDRIEVATDKCEAVANIVESIVVKYA